MTTAIATGINARVRLANYIREHGPVRTIRVSSVRGKTKRYPYWAASRYQIELSRDGIPAHRSVGGGPTLDRRSYRLAEQDAAAIAAEEGRILVDWRIGPLDERQCEYILQRVGG